MELLASLYRAIRYSRITKSPRKLAILARHRNLDHTALAISPTHQLVLSGTQVEIESAQRQFLLQGLSLAADLKEKLAARITENDQKQVVLNVAGVNLVLTCWEELYIAHEVFYHLIYNFCPIAPFQVVDVGMNTGTSALFFASSENCLRVDAFELFEPTAQRAEINLSLNPALRSKIKSNHFGLGSKNETLLLDYFPEYKGSVGRKGLPEYAHPKGVMLQVQKLPVEIRDAVPVFRKIIEDAGGTKIVCKLDCEGSEYDIIRSLKRDGLLERISAFMIEWHLLGPSEIRSTLREAGFSCLSFDEHSGTHGMVYAFR
jgi:FkbM family methyltransferase